MVTVIFSWRGHVHNRAFDRSEGKPSTMRRTANEFLSPERNVNRVRARERLSTRVSRDPKVRHKLELASEAFPPGLVTIEQIGLIRANN